jgi:sulfatase maturation enzyme AslB (radical SAM superfamily)
VLTNGLLLDRDRCLRLAALQAACEYSLDLRLSLDGWDAATNDPIRGDGTFARVMAAIAELWSVGLNPVLTVTEVRAGSASDSGRARFLDLLHDAGVEKPRLKVLPVFQIGAEAERAGGYQSWQRLAADDLDVEAAGHLQCSSCRMVTDQGVWVCPILVNEPQGRMGERLADALGPFALAHSACWTCHVQGVSCRT